MNLLICQSLTVPQVYKFLRMLIFAHFAYFGHIRESKHSNINQTTEKFERCLGNL